MVSIKGSATGQQVRGIDRWSAIFPAEHLDDLP
jgi:hypothetical protein